MNNRYFYMKDIDCTLVVEYATRKEMLEWLDEMCKDLTGSNVDMYDYSDDVYMILYKDGTTDYIDEEYDGHHIKRQNIASIVSINSYSAMVYGHFTMNECGVVEPAFEDEIDDTNIKEVDRENYTECEEVVEESAEEDETCYRLYVNGEVVRTAFESFTLTCALADWFAAGYTADQCEIRKEKYVREDEEESAEETTEETTTKVKAYHGYCIGATVTGLHYYGEIVKTNKKSIRVNFNRFVKTEGKKTVIDKKYNGSGTFTFWKTYNKDGKTIDIYKNKSIGIIEIENKEYRVKGGE